MDNFYPMVLFAVVAAFTPGPNNIMIMSSGVNFGIRRSLPHYLGICLGAPLMMLAAGLGVATVFETVPWLHLFIKLFGVAYLLYLAYRIATSPSDLEASGRAKPLTFFEAALFQWVNPKTWIMGTGAVATYTSVHSELLPQVLLISLVFLALAWPSAGVWLFGGAGLRRVLAQPKHLKLFNWLMAFLLVLSISGAIRLLAAETFAL